jgi:hypothetical protein
MALGDLVACLLEMGDFRNWLDSGIVYYGSCICNSLLHSGEFLLEVCKRNCIYVLEVHFHPQEASQEDTRTVLLH